MEQPGERNEVVQRERQEWRGEKGRERHQCADEERLYGELWFRASPSSIGDNEHLLVPPGSGLTVSMSHALFDGVRKQQWNFTDRFLWF